MTLFSDLPWYDWIVAGAMGALVLTIIAIGARVLTKELKSN